jgi:ribosomal protein L16/L10AE
MKKIELTEEQVRKLRIAVNKKMDQDFEWYSQEIKTSVFPDVSKKSQFENQKEWREILNLLK